MTDSSPSSRTPRPFRFAPYAVLVLLGFALVASNATPSGSRLSRREQLVDLIEAEDERARSLRARLDDLSEQLRAIEDRSAQAQLAELLEEVDGLQGMAGLTALSGPGVRVDLRDSALRTSPSGDPNDLVIHEQDLQAVVNALWGGGAEGVAINGERIISTSAVRCVGNTLLLHGSVYAPPYVIDAVGDADQLLGAIGSDPQVERFRVFAQEFRLGFTTRLLAGITLPAYRGIVAAGVARRPGA